MPYDEKVAEAPIDEQDLEAGEVLPEDDEEKESIVPADELQKEPTPGMDDHDMDKAAKRYAELSKATMTPKDESFDIFLPITKIDESSHTVWGWGAKEEPDQSNEIMDYDTSKPQFLDWSSRAQKRSGGKSMGNLRSMHQNVAAGKIIDLQPDDKNRGFYLGAKVVDEAEWKKVQEGVYTGFSVGGSYMRRWPDNRTPGLIRYTAKPTEMSLVDSPCIPSATFQVVKADGMVIERAFHPGDGSGRALLDVELEKEFDESKHPRDGGKFSTKEGGGGGKTDKNKDKNVEIPKNAPPKNKDEAGWDDWEFSENIPAPAEFKPEHGTRGKLSHENKFSVPTETIGNFIYFSDGAGDLYRAPHDSLADTDTGYPMGARFEGYSHTKEQRLNLARENQKKYGAVTKAFPTAPEPIATESLKGEDRDKTGSDKPVMGGAYELNHMPEQNTSLELPQSGDVPSQEVLQAHAVKAEDFTAMLNQWLPKVGIYVKKAVAEAMEEYKNPKPRMIKVVRASDTSRNIRVIRKE